MGDLVGNAVSGKIYFVPKVQFERLLSLELNPVVQAEVFAALCRINALYMIAKAGSGHIGSSFSSMDIMAWLQLYRVRNARNSLRTVEFFSSKGHDAPALYSTLLGVGCLDYELIHKLRRIDGLPGHPDINTESIITNTGSLGMGVSKAKGMVFANRLLKQAVEMYVITGDGELQEGQFWESLISAANHGLHELTVIVDHNKLQSDTLVSKVSCLGDLEAKFTAFGWRVARCDGNNMAEFAETLTDLNGTADQPKVLIADTVKGKGVSEMEHTSMDSDVELYKFHSGAPSDTSYIKGVSQLVDNANRLLQSIGEGELVLEEVAGSEAPQTTEQRSLIGAYSKALVKHAERNLNIVALDADLVLDTGLIPFKSKYPDRFVECGIAEQDMVSQAGGMALKGLLPIVHSFGCFLTTRPNEQIYNNATELTKVIYVGSLSGLIPAGPGHSHQAVRDVSAVGAMPGMLVVAPSCELELEHILEWAINSCDKSVYIRLASAPYRSNFDTSRSDVPKPGVGVLLEEGQDIAILSYGPILLGESIKAAEVLEQEYGISAAVINMPWLNLVDDNWVAGLLGSYKHIITVEDHYLVGGLGDRVAASVAAGSGDRAKVVRIGISDIPHCGSADEVLNAHGLDAHSIAASVAQRSGCLADSVEQ